ncbi:argininosuccinate lyase [Halobacteriales archaeon QS_4_66_20]|nr:MAG: argininosuccinate lyase [Halobacteriales archaeon QS_4_66_20]
MTSHDEDPEETEDGATTASAGGDHAADEGVVRRERFSGGPARAFLSSLAADERIFAADLAVDRAHVVMLAEQGIIGADDAAAILAALDDVEAAGHGALPDGEDVHEAIETAVIDRVGPAGGRMHTARSRNDEVAACIRYRLREDLLATVGTVVEGRETLLDVAAAETGTVMPGYTHRQPAQPTTVAHWVCSYESALARDTERLLDAYDRVNRSPLGAAAFAGTSFGVDRERAAALLGFDGLVENSMDAASARDFLVESGAAVTGLATTLAGLSTDVVEFASDGYVELADDYASTSSIMPQKKNPDTLELVRSRAGDAASGLSGLVTTLTGLPRAYNRDLQRATGHAWEAVDAVHGAVPVAVGAVATAEWPAETLEAAAGDGFATATGVADRLAVAGIPFRTAHEVVARAGDLADGGNPGVDAIDGACREVLGEPLEVVADVVAVAAALDPIENVAMRDSRGGPAPEAVETHLDRARENLAAHREAAGMRQTHLDDAAETLDAEVASYV